MLSLSDRVLGAFPLSIATSLALEGSVGVHPDQTLNSSFITDYTQIWVNIRTLYRNYFNAITKEYYPKFSIDEHYKTFIQEIELLQSTINQISNGNTELILFHSWYKHIESKFRHALFRNDNTDSQIYYTKSQSELLSKVLKDIKDIRHYDLLINDLDKKSLLLSHFTVDLLPFKYNKVELLESHTGAIKPRALWYTKYYNGKQLVNIPFTKSMLIIFGDNDMFRPNLLPYRKAILSLADKYNWTQVTTLEKINYSLSSLTDKFLQAKLREIVNQ